MSIIRSRKEHIVVHNLIKLSYLQVSPTFPVLFSWTWFMSDIPCKLHSLADISVSPSFHLAVTLRTVLQLALPEGLVESLTQTDVGLSLGAVEELLELSLAGVVHLLLLSHGLGLQLGRGSVLSRGIVAATAATTTPTGDHVAHCVTHSRADSNPSSCGSHLGHHAGLPWGCLCWGMGHGRTRCGVCIGRGGGHGSSLHRSRCWRRCRPP